MTLIDIKYLQFLYCRARYVISLPNRFDLYTSDCIHRKLNCKLKCLLPHNILDDLRFKMFTKMKKTMRKAVFFFFLIFRIFSTCTAWNSPVFHMQGKNKLKKKNLTEKKVPPPSYICRHACALIRSFQYKAVSKISFARGHFWFDLECRAVITNMWS